MSKTLYIRNEHIDEKGRIKKDFLKNFSEITDIYCSYTNIKEFPIFRNNIKSVRCNNCPNLTTLPQWSNIESVICDDCPLLTALPRWPNIKHVSCNRCPLTKLPLWPDVETVYCIECQNLTTLPLWPSVKEIYCSDCPNLITLSLWPKIKKINCEDCPNLIEIPPWPNIKHIHSNRCASLTKFPKFPCIERIDCYGCPLLQLRMSQQKYLYTYEDIYYGKITDIKIYCGPKKINKISTKMKLILLWNFEKINMDLLRLINEFMITQFIVLNVI